jgi:3-oxo-5alpha-steroid 4-dehydrogenase
MREAYLQLPRQSLWFQFMQHLALTQTSAAHAKTLVEVAKKAGLNPDGLVATVAAHNDAIADGRPDPMGKPAEFARRVGNDPYTLLDVSVRPSAINPCPMFTLGGVQVNEQTGAVVTADGEPIPGLYAAGRTAIGICANSYVSGLSLADCIFSGRRAGAHAAAISTGVEL